MTQRENYVLSKPGVGPQFAPTKFVLYMFHGTPLSVKDHVVVTSTNFRGIYALTIPRLLRMK